MNRKFYWTASYLWHINIHLLLEISRVFDFSHLIGMILDAAIPSFQEQPYTFKLIQMGSYIFAIIAYLVLIKTMRLNERSG